MKVFIYLLSILFVLHARAQNRLYPYSDGSKWGLTNSRLKVLTPPQFDFIYADYTPGYVLVKNNGKYGAIDSTGRLTVPCTYERLHFTIGSTAYGELPNGKYIILNLGTNKKVRPEEFEKISNSWCAEMVVTLNGKQGCIDPITYRTVNEIIYDQVLPFPGRTRVRVKKDNKYGIMNVKTGVIIIPIKYDMIGFLPDRSYKKLLQLEANIGDSTFFFDEDGKAQKERYIDNTPNTSKERIIAAGPGTGDVYIVGTKWLDAIHQGNGNWKVMIKSTVSKDSSAILATTELTGYSNLEELGGYEYDDYDKKPAVIKAVKDGHTGLVDFKGNVLVPFLYDNITKGSEYFKTFKDNKIGLLRPDYSLFKKPVFGDLMATYPKLNARHIKMPDGREGYMDLESGKIFIPGVKE